MITDKLNSQKILIVWDDGGLFEINQIAMQCRVGQLT